MPFKHQATLCELSSLTGQPGRPGWLLLWRCDIQTFLPLEDFAASARVLDSKRLGKQRLETLQILKALADPSYGWQNHPAVLMWRGHERQLILYGNHITTEWKRRGYQDSVHQQIADLWDRWPHDSNEKPWWLGDPRLHISHQSNLLRKAPWAYGHLWPNVPRDLDYWWPMENEK